MKLVGADPKAKVTGLNELPGKSNYFIGNDPRRWRTNISSYANVKYESVYPGIDLVYYGNQQQLEYDFIVAPGADPNAIAFDIVGEGSALPRAAGGRPYIDAAGDLVISTDVGDVRFHKPVVYQEQSTVGSWQSAGTSPQQSAVSGQQSPKPETRFLQSKIQNRKSKIG